MAETAAHLVDHVLPVVPIRQWVLSLPYSLRTTLGYDSALLGAVLRVFVRAVSGWIRGKVREKVGLIDARDVHFGAVTFIQRFGDALDLNPHVHSLVPDGAYVVRHGRFEGFVALEAPSDEDVAGIAELVATRVVRMLRRRGKVEDDELAAVEDDGSVAARVRYSFKRTWRDGSVAVEFEPIDFVGKLAALVPRPRSNLVRYHGCLAPHASLRAYVVKDGRGPPPTKAEVASMPTTTMAPLRVESSAALSCAPPRERGLRWPELMQRVFAIDVLLCPSCGRRMKPIAEITSRRVAQKMREHVGVPGDAPEPWPAGHRRRCERPTGSTTSRGRTNQRRTSSRARGAPRRERAA